MIEMKNLGKAYGSKETATVALDHVKSDPLTKGSLWPSWGNRARENPHCCNILGGLDTFDSGEYRLMGKNGWRHERQTPFPSCETKPLALSCRTLR